METRTYLTNTNTFTAKLARINLRVCLLMLVLGLSSLGTVSGQVEFSDQKIITTEADGAQSVFSADLDGDGDMDVLSASPNDNKIAWYENNGSGIFDSQQIIDSDFERANSVIAVDLDNDGDIDVVASSQYAIVWYENYGSGNFSSSREIETLNFNNAPASIFAADLDGDGDMDIISGSRRADKINWYENDGSGGFNFRLEIADDAYNTSVVSI